MESTLQKATDLGMSRSKGIAIGFWIVATLFCLEMSWENSGEPVRRGP
jgi:hypothetical protein